MEEKEFKLGDVVFLNSGSPQMTVINISDNKFYIDVVYWNVTKSIFEERQFLKSTISLVEYDTSDAKI